MFGISTSMEVIVSFILGLFISSTPQVKAYDPSCDSYAHKVYCLTNEQRNIPLKYSKVLTKVSMKKAQDICKKGYWSHDTKEYKWTKFIKESNVNYERAGENLAKNFDNPQKVVEGFMNSPSHRDNVLGDYTHLGVYTEPCKGQNITVQTFAKL